MNAFLYIFFVITGEIKMKKLNRIIKMDSYDAVSFFNGLCFLHQGADRTEDCGDSKQ